MSRATTEFLELLFGNGAINNEIRGGVRLRLSNFERSWQIQVLRCSCA